MLISKVSAGAALKYASNAHIFHIRVTYASLRFSEAALSQQEVRIQGVHLLHVRLYRYIRVRQLAAT